MGAGSQELIKQLRTLVDKDLAADGALERTFQNMHQGYPNETLSRFLKAREWNISKAHKMVIDCLKWRINNDIDNILKKPIVPIDLYRAVRDSQLIGLSGYSKQGQPVFAIGVGLSTLDKASVHYYVQSHIQINEYRDRIVLPDATRKQRRHVGTCLKILDMTGLKISALSQIKLMTTISTVDDLNYPEKTETYYVVNAPYVFSACWKIVKPLLQERTRRKVQVLQGCGRDELLEVMDYASLPHFCRREGSASSRRSSSAVDDCFSSDHHFHQQLYSYIRDKSPREQTNGPLKQGSFHVEVPISDAEGSNIAQKIESEFHKFGYQNGMSQSLSGLKIRDEWPSE